MLKVCGGWWAAATALAALLAGGCSRGTTRVVINGRALTPQQVREVEQTYGARPGPGNYWYDPVSGLYGAAGRPAYGFMLPGHDFGPLAAGASAGRSGVFINGRQLPAEEVAVWGKLLAAPITPGRYWLDGHGNAGVEGVAVPRVNLLVAGRQNGFGGGRRDNFWSGRFSAGNHERGNTRGYVSVPGHGPVGYGLD
jgi:hypothetical protein